MAARRLEDFVDMLIQLTPRGPFWDWLNRHPAEAVRYQRYKAYAREFQRVDQRRCDLRKEAIPSTTNEMLVDWEQFLEITPPAAATVEQRRNAVIAKLFASGDQSVPFYQSIAPLLGHNITITKFKPLQFGDHFGDYWYSEAWRWAWVVISDQAGPDANFEQQIRDLASAHILISFQYNGGN